MDAFRLTRTAAILIALIFAVATASIIFAAAPANAREDKCDKASDRCIDRCNRVFSSPDRQKACWGRCADARANCKGWTSTQPTSHGPVSGDPPKRGPVSQPPNSGGNEQPPSGGKTIGVTPPTTSGSNPGTSGGSSTTIYKKH